MTSSRAPLAVVKVGGDVLLDDAQREGLAHNVRALVDDGWQVVLLHGGGPQVTSLQERLGLVAHKVAGQRVTSSADLLVVEQAICGEVNVALTCLLLRAGVRAFGIHGASGALVQATKRPPVVVAQAGPDPVDYGEVGDVVRIDDALLRGLCALGVVPVIATLGVDAEHGRALNINADTTATRLAAALRAELLLLVTAIGGVYRDVREPASRLASITPTTAKALIADGIIKDGMIPKVEETLQILDAGVGRVAILGAHVHGSFASAARGDGLQGTVFART